MSLALASRKAALLAPWQRNPLWAAARAVPSLDLRFAESKSLVDAVSGQNLVTFTRASGGTYVDSQGVIRNAVTNLLLRSEEFGDAVWGPVRGTVSANHEIAPSGAVTADKLIAANGGVDGQIATPATITSGATVTGSVYVKAGGFDRLELMLLSNNNTTPYGRSTVNPNTGAITTAAFTSNGGSNASSNVQALGNGWYRFSVTVTYPAVTAAGMRLTISNSDASNGDGVKGVFLWGAQLEQSATVGEYIPTGATINSAPRFDHNPTTGESLGLLIEEQRTNLLLRSEEFDNASWNSAAGARTVTANQTAAPDGQSTADRLTADGTNASHFASQSLTLSATPCAFSVFAKADTNNFVQLRGFSGFGSPFVNFNILTGSLGTFGGTASGGTITALGSGWYRCTMLFTPTAATSSLAVYVVTSATATTGETNALATSVFLWGAQAEAGAFPTSYIPTTGTAATRSASLADLISAAIANNIRSFYVEFSSPAVGTRGAVSLNDNTANERLAVITSGTDPRLVVHDGGVEQANIDGGTVTANDRTRVAVRIGTNDFAISVNGGAVVTDTSGTLPTVDRLMLGRTQAGEYLNGRLARFVGWSQLLPDSTLQTLGR